MALSPSITVDENRNNYVPFGAFSGDCQYPNTRNFIDEVKEVMVGFNNAQGIRGLLLIYVIALVPLLIHTVGLTIASIIIDVHPSLVGLHSFVPLGSLLFYVVTNVIEVIYTIVLFILMFKHRKTAILNNIAFNVLSVVFLVVWHFLGEKSLTGTIVDSLPGLVGMCYILMSKRVRNTFVL